MRIFLKTHHQIRISPEILGILREISEDEQRAPDAKKSGDALGPRQNQIFRHSSIISAEKNIETFFLIFCKNQRIAIGFYLFVS